MSPRSCIAPEKNKSLKSLENLDFEAIAQLVKTEISKRIGVDSNRIDLTKPLDDFALDSLNTVRLAGILEENLGLEIEPALMKEYDSLEQMIQQLEIQHQKKILQQQTQKEISFYVVSSFTGEPVEEFLRYWMSQLHYRLRLEFSPYHQVFQELLNPQGALFNNVDGFNVMLIRLEDWFHYEKNSIEPQKIRTLVNDFIATLQTASQQSHFKLILGLCPHCPNQSKKLGILEILPELDQQIIDAVALLANVSFLDLRDLTDKYSLSRIHDPARNQLGHIPFTQEYFAAIGTAVVREVFSHLSPSQKVIVLDCDNTLWQGVCGEDGPLGIKISESFQFLQRFMQKQQESGKLLCLASKNNEEDVWKVFEQNPKMILKREHIVAERINWRPKSQNIQEMAQELQLGLDSFIFIDDNPTECAEVKSALPEVKVLQIPYHPSEMTSLLEHYWAFDVKTETNEDKKRTEMYLQNKQRNALEKQVHSFEDFLKQLEIQIQIQTLKPEDFERAHQLTERTNQFNATTIRYSQQELKKRMNQGDYHLFSVHVKDRFGDYGFVGLMIVQEENNAFICESFLMSCRVLGRRVEQTMLRFLAEKAMEKEISYIRLRFVPSEKNKPIQQFYESLNTPFSPFQNSGMELIFTPAEFIQKVQQSETNYKENTKNVMAKTEQKTVAENYSEKLQKIAEFKGDVSQLIQSIKALSQVKRPEIEKQFVAPRTTWQRKIATIWCDVLRMKKVGIYDNFYELGGDSLQSAEVLARMWDLGVPDSVSLQTIANPTVAGLAQAIEDTKKGQKTKLLMDEFSLEDEVRVPPEIQSPSFDILRTPLSMKNVFITGATGYIAAFLISELFLQSNAKVLCLVRATTKEEGLTRVQKNMQRYGLWKEEYSSRMEIILGDLAQPLFNLSETEFHHLAHQIDSIFHCGAWVNFVYPYQHLQKANVFSVETVLRLTTANQKSPIQLHFISTLGVIMSTGYPKDQLVYESEELKHSEDLLNGYEQSKFVGDKMVRLAMKERGVFASIYRPGMVSGLSQSGVYHKLDEFLPSFLKGCLQMGSWPLLETTWEIVPVDYLAKSIVHIALNPIHIGKTYFSLHPKPRPVIDFIRWHQQFGYPVRALPWDVWKREFLNQGIDRLRKNSLFPFIDFIRALSSNQVFFPPTDKTNFLSAIQGSGIECPDSLTLIERYTQYFIQTGFYPAPVKKSFSCHQKQFEALNSLNS